MRRDPTCPHPCQNLSLREGSQPLATTCSHGLPLWQEVLDSYVNPSPDQVSNNLFPLKQHPGAGSRAPAVGAWSYRLQQLPTGSAQSQPVLCPLACCVHTRMLSACRARLSPGRSLAPSPPPASP